MHGPMCIKKKGFYTFFPSPHFSHPEEEGRRFLRNDGENLYFCSVCETIQVIIILS